MSYTAVGTTVAQQKAAAARAAREASQAAFRAQQSAANALPECIPDRYRAAAQNWCVESQTVHGLGAVDWDLPQEYMADPCAAQALPACPAGAEPVLTPAVLSTSSASAAAATTPAYTPAAPQPASVATVKPNYLMWGLIGGAGLLALLVWRASK